MIAKPEFYGSVTVGERGQISIPSKLRDAMDISHGDKLLVFSGPSAPGFMIIKADMINEIMAQMTKDYENVMKQVAEDTTEEEK